MISKFFFCTGCCCFCFFFGACCCCLFFIELCCFFSSSSSLVPLLSQHTRFPKLLPLLQLNLRRTSGLLVVQLLALLLPRWRTTVPRRQWFLGPVDQQSAATAGWWQVAIPKLVHDSKKTQLELHCGDVVEPLGLVFPCKILNKDTERAQISIAFPLFGHRYCCCGYCRPPLLRRALRCVCGCSDTTLLCVGVSVLTHWELL